MDFGGITNEKSNQSTSNVGEESGKTKAGGGGPRTIQLQKCENGYGFTLRYFVVYPPDSSKEGYGDEGENGKRLHEDSETTNQRLAPQPLDAMDTIFVRHVKAGSEADKAGLATGDRIVSVNGHPVTGKSYNEVLNLIQNCENNLQLLVVPKEDDILQLYFSGSAYKQGSSSSLPETGSGMGISSNDPVTSASSKLTYHDPAYSRSRMASSYSGRPALSSESTDSNPFCRSISSTNSHSLPANFYSGTTDNLDTNLSTTNISNYGNIHHHPCPPPYGYQNKKFTHHDVNTHAPAKVTTQKPVSPYNDNEMRTSKSHSLNDDQLPADIAHQHQSLVNRRKEEFLCNSAGPYDPAVSQQWPFGVNSVKQPRSDLPEVQCKSNQQTNEQILPKTTSNCNLQSETETASISPWNLESALTQTWPSNNSEHMLHSYTNPSLELANIQTSINNSQQSLNSVDDRVNNRTSGVNNYQNQRLALSNKNYDPNRTITSTVNHSDSQDLKYGRSFVTTLSKIQENLLSNSAPKTNQSNPQLEKISTDKASNSVALRKACSLDSEASPTNISSQDFLVQADNEKSIQLQLVSQRAKQFESGGQMWEEEANNKRNLYKNELARMSSHCRTPRVVERTAKYESMSAASSQETICTIPENDGTTSPRNRTSAEVEAKFCHHLAKMGIMTPTVVEAAGLSSPKSASNEQTPIGSTPTGNQHSRDGRLLEHKLRSRTNQIKKSRAMRQNSYLTAVSQDDKCPNGAVNSNMVSNACRSQNSTSYPRGSPRSPQQQLQNVYRQTSSAWLRQQCNGVKRSASVSECSFSQPDGKPMRLNSNRSSTTGHDLMTDHDFFGSQFESLLDDGAISNLIAAFDSMLSGVATNSGPVSPSTTDGTSVQTASPIRSISGTGVVLRKKALYESSTADEDGGGGVRRVSYLKATSVDDGNSEERRINKRAAHIDTEESKHSTPRSHIHSIQKLKSFFGERTPQIVEASEKAQQQQLPSPTKESPSSLSQDVVREGILHCKATLVDGKRASDRSWKPVWAVLRGHALYFYRDKKDANHSPVGMPDEQAPINIKSCIVDIAYDYTKKKNVFRLTTFSVSEFLLQADDNGDMLHWIQCIQDNSDPDNDQKCIGNQNLILRKSSAVSTDHQLSVKDQVARLSPQPTHKGIIKLNFRTRSPTTTSVTSGSTTTHTTTHSPMPAKSSRKTMQSEESSPKSKTWRGKMVKSLRKFHGSSSSANVCQTEGTTIGIMLEDCPVTVNNEFVPLLVELCTKIVEAKGLEIVGIYRIPGNNASVAALQDAVNKGFENLNLQDPRWNDVNVISSLLKAFFRQLPEPLFTGELYPLFIEANKLEDNTQRMITLKKLIHELPEYHYETLQHLMLHLKNVVNNSNINKMEARNLAIVFGPNLVRTADNNMVTMVTDMSHQCRIVETVISHVDWFFSEDDKGFPQPPVTAEAIENSSSNTDLLLGNIQRVEGMSGHHGDVSTKDIVSNIINAANKKVKVKASKKEFDERDIDREIQMRHQKYRRGSAPTESISAKIGSKSSVSDWLRSDGVDSTNSTLSSSSRTLSSQTLSEDSASHQSMDMKPSTESLDQDHGYRGTGNPPPSVPSNEHSKNQAENIIDRFMSSSSLRQSSTEKAPPYTTLSPSTQERIKRFEAETRALLQRDLHTRRSRQDSERHRHELERQRIEMEWQRAKRDMEQEDFLDELADNPSDISRKISDFAYKISDLNTKDDVSGAVKMAETSDYSSSSASPVASQHSLNSKSRPMNSTSTENQKTETKIAFNRNNRLPPRPLDSNRFQTTNHPRLGSPSLRRGNSAENIIDLKNQSTNPTIIRKNLPIKHGGSLDSLREYYVNKDNGNSVTSGSEDGDLLTSITSTLDSKLQVMLTATGRRNHHVMLPAHQSSPTAAESTRDAGLNYRDPSLYRTRTNAPPQSTRTLNKVPPPPPLMASPQRSIYRDPSMHRRNRPNNRQGIVGNEHFLIHFNNSNDELSLLALQDDQKKEVGESDKEIESDTFRREYTTMKATISPSKNTIKVSPASTAILNYSCKEAKTESNLRDKFNNNDLHGSTSRLSKKQKSSSSKPRPLKRRHTVAGIQDFDKFKWLLSSENSRYSKEPRLSAWEQLRPVESIPPEQRSLKSWIQRERLRTSSPDLCHLKRMSLGDGFALVPANIGKKMDIAPMPALESLV